jgi:hypothetical protein
LTTSSADGEGEIVGRVEWAALEGGEVETVLANLIYNKYGRAVRVRPAKGDFGIDVIVPATAAPEPWDIYQIKKFATNLSDNQKGQIEKSFARLLIGIVRKNYQINNWYLVLPLDPTPGNLEWFKTIPKEAIEIAKNAKADPLTDAEEAEVLKWLDGPTPPQIEWKGLTFCESLAAEFPYVTDHYLHGGAERLRSAVDSVAGLLEGHLKAREASAAEPGEGKTALMEPSEVAEHLTLLDSVLDTDPHYTYGHTIGPGRSAIHPEPNLVAAAQRALPGDRWLTFRIYQRSAQSLDERPIPVKLEFKFEDGSPDAEALSAWQKYGKPFEAAASFSIDLPGGLGGSGEAGRVAVPARGGVNAYQLRLRILDPADQVLAQLTFDMESTVGQDRTGAWASGADLSGTLEHQAFVDLNTGASQNIQFTLRPLAGLVATDAAEAVRFARHLESPNRIQMAGPVGPFEDAYPLDGLEAIAAPAVERIVSALATIQTQTKHIITIPDVTALSREELQQVGRAAALIEGGTRVGTWTHLNFDVFSDDTVVGEHIQVEVYLPLKVTLEGTEVEVGAVKSTLSSAEVESVTTGEVRLVPKLNDTVYEVFVAEIPVGAPENRGLVRNRPHPGAPDVGFDKQ